MVETLFNALRHIQARFIFSSADVSLIAEMDRKLVEFTIIECNQALNYGPEKTEAILQKFEADRFYGQFSGAPKLHCLVLLSSYFCDSADDIFRWALGWKAVHGQLDRLEKIIEWYESKNACVLDRANEFEVGGAIFIRETLNAQRFRAFDSQIPNLLDFGLNIEPTLFNDLMCALQLRHCIAHSAGTIDEKCIAFLADYFPRTLKPNISAGQELTLSIDELNLVSKCMESYISTFAATVCLSNGMVEDEHEPLF